MKAELIQGKDSGCFIIAEAGVNHNGRLDLALKLCEEAKKAGADAVKFQTYITERIITRTVEQAEYQKNNTGENASQYEMLKSLELSFSDFRKVKEYCDQLGIAFLSTADEEESLDFLVSLRIPCIKIGSGDIGNLRFLRYAGGKGLPVILSTGMSTLSDIDLSLNALRAGGAENITLLHCTTSYPCRYADVNLRAMVTLRDAFHLPVGYSDHTLGNIVSVSAVALGARVIEKHFTLDKEMKGPDHKASASPEELKSLVDDIRNIEQALGDGRKEPTETERGIMPVVVKRIVAKQLIPEGKILSAEDICVKRNDKGLEAKYTELLIGTRAGKEYLPDEPIELV